MDARRIGIVVDRHSHWSLDLLRLVRSVSLIPDTFFTTGFFRNQALCVTIEGGTPLILPRAATAVAFMYYRGWSIKRILAGLVQLMPDYADSMVAGLICR